MNHLSRRLAIILIVSQIILTLMLLTHSLLDLFDHCSVEKVIC